MSKISEPYRRGFQRGIQAAASLAWQRKLACEEAADRYDKEKPNEPYWARSERCAAREATHIWEETLKLKPQADM